MIVALDHLIFGNGHGLRTPFFDGKFYWLSGQFYTFTGWFGCQLQSFQWTHPKPQERRVLAGFEFAPFQSHRELLRVRVTWRMTKLDGAPMDLANAHIRELRTELDRL